MGDSANIVASSVTDTGGYLAFNGTLYGPDLSRIAAFGTSSTWLHPVAGGGHVNGAGATNGDRTVSLIDTATGTTAWTIVTEHSDPLMSPAMGGLITYAGLADNGTAIEFWR